MTTDDDLPGVFYSEDQARERLGIDDVQFARLSESIRAPLWYNTGGKVLYSRETVDQMVRDRSAPGRVTPSTAQQSLAGIIADQAVLSCGADSFYVRQMQDATGALVAAFRATDQALRYKRLTEAQASGLAASIAALATEMQAMAGP